ncbi:MAG TPA: hypothetical protein DDX05_09005 [Deltaproteobacteria bacterium]|nr:MAG: hypothetical protein A2X91_03250 [Deltaproteobacteria bacterium GWB2_65_81]HBG73734.1 hypothetical protein [Deltaproteobacteria bacterium]
MTGRKFLFSLAFGVLMGTFAGVAIANEQGMDSYGPWDSSFSAEPERSVGQPEEGESRGPMETGAVPSRFGSSSDPSSDAGSDRKTVEIGGQLFREAIDTP